VRYISKVHLENWFLCHVVSVCLLCGLHAVFLRDKKVEEGFERGLQFMVVPL